MPVPRLRSWYHVDSDDVDTLDKYYSLNASARIHVRATVLRLFQMPFPVAQELMPQQTDERHQPPALAPAPAAAGHAARQALRLVSAASGGRSG
jgi:hypothetical protein